MSELESAPDVEVWQPSFLENFEEEISNHKTQATKLLKYLHDQYETFESHCEDVLGLETSYCNRLIESPHYKTQLKKLQKGCDAEEDKAFKLEQSFKNSVAELKRLKSQTEEIQDFILQQSEDIKKLTLLEEQLTSQRKEATKSMELMWRSYVGAKNMYKKNLQCHIRLHEPAEKTDESTLSQPGENLTFSYVMDDKTLMEVQLNRNNNSWEMLHVHPFSPGAEEAQKNLCKTNDIRYFMCCLREEALKLAEM